MITHINGTHARTQRFGSGGTVLRAGQGTALTKEEICAACPSVFARGKHNSRSDRYSYIPTPKLISGLRKEGFLPVEIRQGGSRDLEKRNFTKHLLRFRRPENLTRVLNDSVPELVLLNSHDGTSSYQLMMGWFRLVCLNGMIVADNEHESSGIKVIHRGNVMDDVIEAAYTVVNDVDDQSNLIEDMRNVALTEGEQDAFGEAAGALRFPESAQVDPRQVLRVHRQEDVGNSLWLTFNRAQENLVRGGVRYRTVNANGHVSKRHTREVNGIDGNVGLNRALWILAEKMRQIKVAA